MEDTAPAGTEVIVFRLDSKTLVGKGVIECWMPISEVPDEEEELLADTEGTGLQPTFEFDTVTVFHNDGSESSFEEALKAMEIRIPRIRLHDGCITYGSHCFWEISSGDQNPESN